MKPENFDELSTFLYSKKNNHWLKLSEPSSAFLYKKSVRQNLITGESEKYPIENYKKKLEVEKIFLNQQYKIHHLFFELGYHYFDLPFSENDILALEIEYKKKERCHFSFEDSKKDLTLKFRDSTSKQGYKDVLNAIFEKIKQGEFYQLNYTQRWQGIFKYSVADYLKSYIEKNTFTGAMAHFTIVPTLNKVWFSNTPECLFVVRPKNKKILEAQSFPIKGTVSLNNNQEIARKKLEKSKKDLAELDMITDLMRNDLNKIETPNAHVLKRRFFFKVPGLYHQASKVVTHFSTKVTLGMLIQSLFPGGSITGAPKKATLKYIASYEKSKRGFYCGTTVYHTKDQCCASINIRSAVFDVRDKKIEVAAGGGITLKSKIDDEWNEMQNKKLSLINLWK